MKVGILGGTFDPPHIGHQILAQEALDELALDQVVWVPTPYPPHKMSIKISPIQNRMSMVLLAISGNNKFKLSRVDIDRTPPHYAVDTVALLREKNPGDEFFYLMGADSLNDLKDWHAPERFVAVCHHIVVMRRCGETVDTGKLEMLFPGITLKLIVLDTPLIEVSGTDLRNRVRDGRQIHYFVPDSVYHYILNHKLYQD